MAIRRIGLLLSDVYSMKMIGYEQLNINLFMTNNEINDLDLCNFVVVTAVRICSAWENKEFSTVVIGFAE